MKEDETSGTVSSEGLNNHDAKNKRVSERNKDCAVYDHIGPAIIPGMTIEDYFNSMK